MQGKAAEPSGDGIATYGTKRNEKTTANFGIGRSYFVLFGLLRRYKSVKNVNCSTLRLGNLQISKDNCNFAALKE